MHRLRKKCHARYDAETEIWTKFLSMEKLVGKLVSLDLFLIGARNFVQSISKRYLVLVTNRERFSILAEAIKV